MQNRSLLLSLITALAVLCVPLAAQASPPAQASYPGTRSESCKLYGSYTYCLVYFTENDCSGWAINMFSIDMHTNDPSYRHMRYEGGSNVDGPWDQPGVLESYTYNGSWAWLDGSGGVLYSQQLTITLNEPAACEPNASRPASNGCPVTPRYFMYTLQDDNQPAGWQPYCYVISSNGFPSDARQAGACSVPGSGYTFKGTSAPYAGWVSTDCYGNATYGWPAWNPAWYHH